MKLNKSTTRSPMRKKPPTGIQTIKYRIKVDNFVLFIYSYHKFDVDKRY